MAALITLSIDMTELHVSDKFGNINTFDLKSGGGVIISSVNGVLSASSASSSPTATVSVPLSGNKWQISYYEPTDLAFLIGTIDIEVGISSDHHEFDLSNNDLQIWNDGTNLKASLV